MTSLFESLFSWKRGKSQKKKAIYNIQHIYLKIRHSWSGFFTSNHSNQQIFGVDEKYFHLTRSLGIRKKDSVISKDSNLFQLVQICFGVF